MPEEITKLVFIRGRESKLDFINLSFAHNMYSI